ncbi:hypothetical protein D3C72_1657220 [compost metagenome]
MRVDHSDQERRNDQERRPAERDTRPERDRDVQHDLVCKLDQVARDAAPNEQTDGEVALLQVVGRTDKGIARIRHRAGEEAPEDDAERQVRKELVQRGAEQGAVQRPHAADHGPHAEREPQGAEHRAPVAQHDIEPGERPPDVGPACTFPPVSEDAAVQI